MSETTVKLSFQRSFSGRLDAPQASIPLGKEEGQLRPYDLLLGALGSCFYSTFLGIADKMRLDYTEADLFIHGIKREEVPTTLKTVDMVFTIKGAKEQKGFERASELAAKYCSIHETIAQVAEIRLELAFMD